MLPFSKRRTPLPLAMILISIWTPIVLAWQSSNRHFSMGFTPWPYDATVEALEDTYQAIQQYGDLVAHHLGGGIPWQEALDGTVYPDALMGEIAARKSRTQRPVYLAIEALNSARDGLALYWGTEENQPLEAPWQMRSWRDPEVIEAYIRFALDMIDQFQPRYFNYGVEVSDLIRHNPQGFEDFKVFAAEVYPRIKAAHPELELLVSVALQSPCSQDGMAISNQMRSLMPYVDMVGVSVYGYAFFDHQHRGDPSTLPPGWLTQVQNFSAGKPIAITETGWIAQDLTIQEFGLSVSANAQHQQAYVSQLLTAANQWDLAFVIWFAVRDYDALWSDVLNQDPTAAIWRDTGLLDEMGNARPALATWSNWLTKPRHQFIIPHLATGWNNYLFVDHAGERPAEFTIEWFDETGSPGGQQTFSTSKFERLDLSQNFPNAHSARLLSATDRTAFRLTYVEPTEKGMAEFALTEAHHRSLQFNFPLFDATEVPLTWKGLAVYHDGNEDVLVNFQAFDADGTLMGETEIALLPHQRFRATLSAMFGISTEQMLATTRVLANTTKGELAGLNIAGTGLSRLLFTLATPNR